MAPPRKFSYERLKTLLRDHPTWTYPEYADVLTRDERRTNPAAPRVLPNSVRRVVHEYRDEWQEEGIQLPARGVVNADLMPPLGSVAPNQRMTTPLRYLREISAERRGEAPVGDSGRMRRRQALRWEARQRDNREIVDINDNQMVIVRPARPDELDEKGNLIELAAWAIPGGVPPQRHSLRGRG